MSRRRSRSRGSRIEALLHGTCRFPLSAVWECLAAAHSIFDDDRRLAAADVAVDRFVHVGIGQLAEVLRPQRLAAAARLIAGGCRASGGLARPWIEDWHVAG